MSWLRAPSAHLADAHDQGAESAPLAGAPDAARLRSLHAAAALLLPCTWRALHAAAALHGTAALHLLAAATATFHLGPLPRCTASHHRTRHPIRHRPHAGAHPSTTTALLALWRCLEPHALAGSAAPATHAGLRHPPRRRLHPVAATPATTRCPLTAIAPRTATSSSRTARPFATLDAFAPLTTFAARAAFSSRATLTARAAFATLAAFASRAAFAPLASFAARATFTTLAPQAALTTFAELPPHGLTTLFQAAAHRLASLRVDQPRTPLRGTLPLPTAGFGRRLALDRRRAGWQLTAGFLRRHPSGDAKGKQAD